MKKILCVMMLLLGVTASFAQNSVTLTFASQTTDGEYIQPDSITIENLTRNWTETIYYPDTVYTLNVGTSVPSHPNDNDIQVMPNPFDGTTRVNIKSPKMENVKITLTDMAGRVCTEFSGVLQEGGNLFTVTLTTPQTYVLSMQTSSGIRSLKMENVGRAGANRIAYEGAADDNISVVQLKSSSNHPFQLGDEMRLSVYAYLNDTLMAHQTVTQGQSADDNVVVTFPVSQSSLNITSCPVVSVRTNETGFSNRVSHVQDYDGNEYQVVQIGDQCWMKENLRVTHFPDDNEISLGNNSSSSTPYRYFPNNNSSNVSVFGYLYNWKAVMNGAATSTDNPSGVQGICPEGWHVPSNAEWTQLINYVKDDNTYVCGSNTSNIAKALAATTNWNTSTSQCAPGNDSATNNTTGFTAISAGVFSNNDYSGYSQSSSFWTSTEYGSSNTTCYNISYNNPQVLSDNRNKHDGATVRCVRNQQNNNEGVIYGTLPSVYSTTISNTTQTTAYATSILTWEGSTDVTEKGFCWSLAYCPLSHYPTIDDSYVVASDGFGIGHFSATLSGLTPNTTYWVRSWARNSAGIAYGNPRAFTTQSADGQPCSYATTITDYDGNVYNTVQIGDQCWMKENLRTTHYANGAGIPFGGTLSCSNDSPSYTAVSPFYYKNMNANNPLCGFLYNWTSVMHGAASSNSNPSNVQGVCPNGWHVPSFSEWNQLTTYVNSQPQYRCNNQPGLIAKALSAESSGWISWCCDPLSSDDFSTCSPGLGISSNNATGFSALPAGGTDATFYYVEEEETTYFYLPIYGEVPIASFWTSTQSGSNTANKLDICGIIGNVLNFEQEKVNALSVRCVKD